MAITRHKKEMNKKQVNKKSIIFFKNNSTGLSRKNHTSPSQELPTGVYKPLSHLVKHKVLQGNTKIINATQTKQQRV